MMNQNVYERAKLVFPEHAKRIRLYQSRSYLLWIGSVSNGILLGILGPVIVYLTLRGIQDPIIQWAANDATQFAWINKEAVQIVYLFLTRLIIAGATLGGVIGLFSAYSRRHEMNRLGEELEMKVISAISLMELAKWDGNAKIDSKTLVFPSPKQDRLNIAAHQSFIKG